MRRLVSGFAAVVCLVLAAPVASADEGATVNVQGRLVNDAGNPAPDGDYVGVFSLWDSEDGGTQLWTETQGIVVQGAQFSALLGLSTTLSGTVFADNADLWMQLKIGSEPALPRRPLHAIPLATVSRSLSCSGCVTASHLDGASTDSMIAAQGYLKASDLASVAVSGNYSDLKGAPNLAAVALSGSYADLAETPVLAAVALSGGYADLSGTPSLAAVALSGSYDDLSDTPSLATVALSGSYEDLSETPTLAAVALSGAFSDLSGGPDLTGYAKPTETNTWTALQTLGADLDFANNVARRFRLQAAETEPTPCTADAVGLIYYNTTAAQVLMCDGKVYASIAFVGELGSIGNPAVTCLDLKTQKPITSTGYYYIDPTGAGAVRVYCEMTLEGGGWTLVGKFNLNVTGPVIGGVTWRADTDVNLGYLGADDNDAVFNAGHLSVERTRAVVNAGDRKMMNLVKQHSTQKNKYCWNHYAAGPDTNWSYTSGTSGSPGVGSCGLLGWGYGLSCGATSTSCASHDANYSMDDHWMHANGLNQGTLSGTIQTYCGGNSTSGIGHSAAATGDRRGTCYLYAR